MSSPQAKISAKFCYNCLYQTSVVAAKAGYFAILGNKLCKITIMFGELDHIKSQRVVCQPKVIG